MRPAHASFVGLSILVTASAWADVSPRATVADPTLTSPVSLPSTAAILRASKNDTEVAIQGSKAFTREEGVLALGIKLSGPVGASSSAPTKLATLDGLDDSTTVELNISGLRWKIPAPDSSQIAAVCLKYLGTRECKRSDLTTLEAQQQFDRAVDYGYPILVHVSGRLGYRSLDYVDDATLEKATQSGYPWAATAGAGVVVPSVGYLGAGYRREHSLTAQGAVQLCTPIGPVGTLTCADTSVGKPETTDSNLLSVEARVFFASFAANPMVTFDLSKKVTGIQVPTYFLKSDDGGLIAGITPSWRSDTKDLAAFLFVGGSLGLLPAGMTP